MAQISRRAAVALLLAAPIGVLAACSPRPVGEASLSPSTPAPTTTGAAAPPADPGAAGVAGPTGLNWPTRTPTSDFDVSEECDCTWQDISDAITRVGDQSPDGRARVLVRPGSLPGFGAGSTKEPVLQGIGTAGRAYRVLVIPRDGVGSVTFDASIRIDAVVGVAFVGFWSYPSSVVLTSVSDFAWAWSKGQAFNITSGAGGPVDDVELVECVTPELSTVAGDTWAFRTDGNPYRNISMLGCYVGPTYKPADSTAHCDTLQLSGPDDKSGLLIRDSVIFASTNAAFIPSAGASGIVFDRSLVVAGDRMLVRYPLPASANAFVSGPPAAVNAAGSVDLISGTSSTFIGTVRGTWLDVQDCAVSAAEPPPATAGQFTSDPSLGEIDSAWLDARAPMPTDERLRQIWALDAS